MKRFLSSLAVSTLALAGITFWLGSQAEAAINFHVPGFAKEIIEAHGKDITGTAVNVAQVSFDWSARRLSLTTLTASNPPGYLSPNAMLASNVTLAMDPAMTPDWHRASLLPQPVPVQSLEVSDVTLHYDIDSEAENLRTLRDKLAAKSSLARQLRLDAAKNGTEGPLLLSVQQMQIRNIKVEARSRETPARNKDFILKDQTLRTPGNGPITIAELLDTATLALIDDVNREALAQGVILPDPEPVAEDSTGERKVRPRKRVAQTATPAEDSPRESKFERGVGKAVDGTKNVAKKTWNFISSPFRKDKD